LSKSLQSKNSCYDLQRNYPVLRVILQVVLWAVLREVLREVLRAVL
jgi:hypothetical protein